MRPSTKAPFQSCRWKEVPEGSSLDYEIGQASPRSKGCFAGAAPVAGQPISNRFLIERDKVVFAVGDLGAGPTLLIIE